MTKYKLLIIGAGAAGMMAGCSAVMNGMSGRDILILDHNEKAGKKIYITGKGRCNLTNNCDYDTFFSSVRKNSRFLYSAFYSFTNSDVMSFFEDNGCKLKVERGDRVFPVSDKSADVIDALKRRLSRDKVEIRLHNNVSKINVSDGHIESIICDSGEIFCDKLIVATGGLSYPTTGSDGSGFKLVSELGHTITETMPALVGLETEETYVKDLMGLSLKNVSLKIFDENSRKKLYEGFGEMLFTHYGISGPLVLKASSDLAERIHRGERLKAYIDLKPALDDKALADRVLRAFNENINKDFINALTGLLPSAMKEVFVELTGIDHHKKINEIKKEERERLVSLIRAFPLSITKLRGFEEAVITRGGVSVKEINPSTMESKLVSGLYFAGEIIDVDAYTGGFNLQIAFSTGYLAGMN